MSDSIPFIVDSEDDETKPAELEAFGEPTLSGRSNPFSKEAAKRQLKQVDLQIRDLRESVAGITESLGKVFADLKQVGGYELKEVSVTAQVSAQGKIILIGSAEARGSLTLKFAPPESQD